MPFDKLTVNQAGGKSVRYLWKARRLEGLDESEHEEEMYSTSGGRADHMGLKWDVKEGLIWRNGDELIFHRWYVQTEY